jgi:hypothetical protein
MLKAFFVNYDWQFSLVCSVKIFRYFFICPRQAAPDITMAEQRMPALILLCIGMAWIWPQFWVFHPEV